MPFPRDLVINSKHGIAWHFPRGTVSERRFPAVARAIGPEKVKGKMPLQMSPRNPVPKNQTLQRVSRVRLESRREARIRQKKKLQAREIQRRIKAITTKGTRKRAREMKTRHARKKGRGKGRFKGRT